MIEDFFSTWIFNSFAGGASIVGLIWLIIENLRRRDSVAKLAEHTERVFTSSKLDKLGIEFAINGHPAKQLLRQTFLILNETEQTFSEQEFFKTPTIAFSKHAQILSADVLQGEGLQTATIEKEMNALKLTDFLVPPGEALLISIVHDDVRRTIDCKPKFQPELRRIKSFRHWSDLATLLIIAALVIVSTSFVEIYLRHNPSTPSGLADLIYLSPIVLLLAAMFARSKVKAHLLAPAKKSFIEAVQPTR